MNNIKKLINLAIILIITIILAQSSTIYAALASSPVGIVNYQYLLQMHPDTAQAQAAFDAAVKQAQDDFNAKAPNMSDQDKKTLYQQLQQTIQQKQQDLLNPIRVKVNAAIKTVADAKGLTIVVDKNVTVYVGQDITDDVMKAITGK